MNKIKKILKWFLIFISLFSIILGITIYISSLFSYKESDFNIPKSFFETRFEAKDEKSEKNGFNEFVEFNKMLERDFKNKFNVGYLDLLSKCKFSDKIKDCEERKKEIYNKNLNKKNKTIKKNYIDNKEKNIDTIIENQIWKDLIEAKFYIRKYNMKFNKLLEKSDFIKPTKEYSKYNWKYIIYSSLIQYFRTSNYVAYTYFEKNNQESWLKILLQNQRNIDKLLNKADFNLIWNLVLITLEKQNIEAIKYFLENYEIKEEDKNKIKLVLEKNIYDKLIKNWMKHEYYIEINSYDDFINYKTWKFFLDNKRKIKYFLFYSDIENKLLIKNKYFEIISNNWEALFKSKLNINNYFWRKNHNHSIFIYSSQFKREEDMHKLRKEVLDLLQGSPWD